MSHDRPRRARRRGERDEIPFDVAHALAPVQAVDLDGNPVRLGTLWEDRSAVLVFLRHFG
jgi:hypothetical protein